MCGICGIVGSSAPENIAGMVAAMHHRGPDDSGIFREDGIAMAMARLAIIDVTPSGHQPMANADKSIWIVYNGETYNFQEERQILLGRGHSFVSSSDTEVVLRMYEEYGDEFLLRMRGMFALAVYDKRCGQSRERLLLARDHLGIKPLLYARVGARFVFASEVKALLASGLIEPEFDPEALRLLLTFGSITQPRTAIKGVSMLLPGHRLIIESGRERLECYWRLKTDRFAGLRELPYEELVSRVKSALEESVRLQMVSDVPVGAFLSGGVDSSLLVALMSRISGHKVRTFSVGFEAEGAHMDETDDAQRVASFLGTDHSRVVVTGQEVRARISHIAAALDQPSVDGVNSYFVSAAARQGVTVAISGTGGDELFAGYPWFISMVLASVREQEHTWRGALRAMLASAARQPCFDPLMAGRLGPVIDKVRSLSGFMSIYARIYQIFGAARSARMLSPAMRQSARIGQESALDLAFADELSGEAPLERVSALCLRGYAQNQLLRDIDAVSMAHSLEVRVPFLDPVLTDLALSLPLQAKLNDVSRLPNPAASSYRETGVKKILVDVGRELLPDGMDLQVKRGFGMPFESWLKGDLRDVFEDALSPSALKRRNFFDIREAQSLKNDFLAGKQGWARPWLLMMIELWCREVLDKSSLHRGNHGKGA
jgi:asparagine synthase (glutamine-hydrolysing)